jgi:hypothetical protein
MRTPLSRKVNVQLAFCSYIVHLDVDDLTTVSEIHAVFIYRVEICWAGSSWLWTLLTVALSGIRP